MTMVHPVDPHHFVRALSTVRGTPLDLSSFLLLTLSLSLYSLFSYS
jgi:hypothetical protein